MATFSQRMGIEPSDKPEQKQDMDADLRNTIWNVLCIYLWDQWRAHPDPYNSREAQESRKVTELYFAIWVRYLKWPLDQQPVFKADYSKDDGYHALRKVILSGPWNKAYDLLDFIVRNNELNKDDLVRVLNDVLERENSGYRVINDMLAPVTSPVERESIETAIEGTTAEIAEHLATALQKLSDRKKPDYRNSIKESISAVEAACQAIACKPGATLGDCLKTIKGVHPIHPAMEQALLKIYGYTSNEGGIRHALNDDSITPTAADANFMLVSCSAFVNFLWTVAAEAGLTVGVPASKGD